MVGDLWATCWPIESENAFELLTFSRLDSEEVVLSSVWLFVPSLNLSQVNSTIMSMIPTQTPMTIMINIPSKLAKPKCWGAFNWYLSTGQSDKPRQIHLSSSVAMYPPALLRTNEWPGINYYHGVHVCILSWNSRISNVIFSAQYKFLRSPIPYPDRPKRSPTVIRSQFWAASYSNRELSQIKACKVLKEKQDFQ